jgi:hypothetical protein
MVHQPQAAPPAPTVRVVNEKPLMTGLLLRACSIAHVMAARIATPEHWRDAKKAVRGLSSRDAFPTPRAPSSVGQKDNNRSSIILIVKCCC